MDINSYGGGINMPCKSYYSKQFLCKSCFCYKLPLLRKEHKKNKGENKWNISIVQGSNITDIKIEEILREFKILELSELSYFLQNRTKDVIILNNNKKKNILNYIRNVLGGLKHHLEKNDKYIILNKDNKLFVELNNYKTEWILINNNED